MKKRIGLVSETGYSMNDLGLPENLVEFSAWVQGLLDQIPEQYRNSAEITLYTERDFDSAVICMNVFYEREETPEELAQRLADQKIGKSRAYREKWQQIEKLKKELEELE